MRPPIVGTGHYGFRGVFNAAEIATFIVDHVDDAVIEEFAGVVSDLTRKAPLGAPLAIGELGSGSRAVRSRS